MKFTQLMHQGIANPSHSMANKGGGGGSPYYENMDRLYGAQARAAEFMLDQSMPNLPTYMGNSARMVDDAFNGELANRARNTANADAQESIGMGLAAANRNLERYGAEFNPTKMMYANRSAGLQGAAMRSGAMNSATQWAEDQKWNRNAGALAQATGMGSGAMSSMGSSAAGYGAAGNAQMGNDAANAQGMGQFGAAMAQGLMKADGGYIDRAPKLAAGGDAWSAWKDKNPIQTGGLRGGSGMSPVSGVIAGAAPYLAAEGIKGIGKGGVAKSLGLADTATAAPVTTGVSTTGVAANGLGDAAAGEALQSASGNALVEGLSTTAPGVAPEVGAMASGAGASVGAGTSAAVAEGAATGAAGAAGGGAMAGLAAAAPWLIGGYALGTALDLWADGGNVPHEGDPRGLKRKDMRPGGKVTGPGTETSDDIPAWLSNGEFVLNAEAVKLIGKKKLEALNNRGLKIRGKKEEAAEGRPNIKDSPAEERREARGLKTKRTATKKGA